MPFTAPRATNYRYWLYRMRPMVQHISGFAAIEMPYYWSAPAVGEPKLPLAPMRLDPSPVPDEQLTFVTGIRTIVTAGDVHTQTGHAIHTFAVIGDMEDDYFYNADGELLIVPHCGDLRFMTEFGIIEIAPGDILLFRAA